MLLLHIRHGEVGEGRLLVVVERALLHLTAKLRIVAAEFTDHRADTERIAEVGVVNVLIGEVVDEVILCTSGNKGVARQRSLRAGAGIEGKGVIEGGRVGHAEFTAAAKEFCQAALAETVVLVAAVLHQTVALHARTVDAAGQRYGPVRRGKFIITPRLSFVHVDVVVVAEAIAFANHTIRTTHVVLRFVGGDAVIIHRKLVEVSVASGTEQVRHGLVVHAVRMVELYAEGDAMVHVEGVIERRTQRPHALIVVATFQIVERFSALLFVAAVDKVELIPIDLSVGLVGRPMLAKGLPLFEQEVLVRHVVFVRTAARAVAAPHIAHGRGEVLIVVRAWIVGIAVPTERSAAVERISIAQVSRHAHIVVIGLPVPRQDARGGKGSHHARITLFAVLVTPVWVVVVRVGQPIGLFCRRRLLRTLGRCAVGHEREGVVRAEAFFRREKIRRRVVERAFDHTFRCAAIAHRSRERPTV